MSAHDQVGIIVPVLDDAEALRRLLSWRRKECPDVPIWVVDGGSNDNSVVVAQELGAAVIASGKGRGLQMNAGARATIAAGCEVFWFLHADALPSEDAIQRIKRALNNGAIGGGFKRRFEFPSVFLKLTCLLADWRCRFRGWFLGDQGIFVTRQAFEELGGFPEWAWFEDLDFSRRMARIGRTAWIDATIWTSGRRFERLGAWRQTWRDFLATRQYLRHGVPPPTGVDERNAHRPEIIPEAGRPSSR
jgi:rSAM/selenodomain-associated transferase 2